MAECTLEERIEASLYIANFRKKIVDSVGYFIAEVDEAITNLEEALKQF